MFARRCFRANYCFGSAARRKNSTYSRTEKSPSTAEAHAHHTWSGWSVCAQVETHSSLASFCGPYNRLCTRLVAREREERYNSRQFGHEWDPQQHKILKYMLSHLKIRRNATECILPWIELFLLALLLHSLLCCANFSWTRLLHFVFGVELWSRKFSIELESWKELSWRTTQKSGRTNRVEKEFEVFTGAAGKC